MEIEPFLLRAQAHERADALEHIGETELCQRELHLARLDLREVEDVIDEVQKRLPGFMRAMRVRAGVFFAALAQNHLVHAEDGVDWRADFVRHVREEGTLCLAGLVGLHHAPLAREEVNRADGEQQHEHGEHPDDEAHDGEQAAVERRRWHKADDLAVHALHVRHEHDVFLLVVERGRWRAVEACTQLSQDAAGLHAVDVASVGLRPFSAAHRHGAAREHEHHAARAVKAVDVKFFRELALRVVAVQHIADVFAIEHGHGQEKPFAACIADSGIPLERLADAIPFADFQRVADDGAAAVREHAHALDAHAIDIIF